MIAELLNMSGRTSLRDCNTEDTQMRPYSLNSVRGRTKSCFPSVTLSDENEFICISQVQFGDACMCLGIALVAKHKWNFSRNLTENPNWIGENHLFFFPVSKTLTCAL